MSMQRCSIKLRQDKELLIGMSTRRYLPAKGTAGLQRSLVKGFKRDPRPPPIIMQMTFLFFIRPKIQEKHATRIMLAIN